MGTNYHVEISRVITQLYEALLTVVLLTPLIGQLTDQSLLIKSG